MNKSETIDKHPRLEQAEDYAFLRRKGLEHIERLGSKLWTDYNIHDPGITLLELLCYALTDLGYRTGFSVADLLAPPDGKPVDLEKLGFHPAEKILTINPLTIRDYRKLLIDIDGIKNGWLQVREGCGSVSLYADCAKGVLQYAPVTDHPIAIKGLYDVMVEFGDEERVGDLNSGRIYTNFNYGGATGRWNALLELRLPSWQALEADAAKYADFRLPGSRLIVSTNLDKAVKVDFISGNKPDFGDVPVSERSKALRRTLFATLKVRFLKVAGDAGSESGLVLEDVPLKVWKSDRSAPDPTWGDLYLAIEDPSGSGPLAKYHEMALRADAVMVKVRQTLHRHRNLCEDYCAIKAVAVEEISVCLDLDLEPAADIEGVVAEAWIRIEEYLSPNIVFHSLREMMDEGAPSEEIFDGPRLENGFLENGEVDATNLKTVIYASDIIGLLMDIPGVKAVRNFSMSKYDSEGRQGPAVEWELPVTAGHQPRFYAEASKVLAFKNGYPFLPAVDELNDVLPVVRARRAQAGFSKLENTIQVAPGRYYPLEDYFPLQYQLPQTYGVGPEGLPPTASPQRLAQARQLKAYLLFFEQLLVDYLSQLAHVSSLLAAGGEDTPTYFGRFIDEKTILGVEGELYRGFDAGKLAGLEESEFGRLDRRNRFLDHLMARFAESFADYSVMLLQSIGKDQAAKELVKGKIAFLKDLPEMTHDRAKAFDYKAPAAICRPDSKNAAGLNLKIRRMLCLEEKEKIFVVEHLLLRPRRAGQDERLPICLPPDCAACGGEDPYSFRLSVILSGKGGRYNEDIEWRRFAERAIRTEVPAHLAPKICWVSQEQLAKFENLYCDWLAELAKAAPTPDVLGGKLSSLLAEFKVLKSVYPKATLHDCVDGNDANRVLLNQTAITSFPKK